MSQNFVYKCIAIIFTFARSRTLLKMGKSRATGEPARKSSGKPGKPGKSGWAKWREKNPLTLPPPQPLPQPLPLPEPLPLPPPQPMSHKEAPEEEEFSQSDMRRIYKKLTEARATIQRLNAIASEVHRCNAIRFQCEAYCRQYNWKFPFPKLTAQEEARTKAVYTFEEHMEEM